VGRAYPSPGTEPGLSSIEFALVLASALLHAGWSASIKGSRDPLVFNLLQEVPVFVLAGAALPLVEWSEIPAPVWRWLAFTSVAHAYYFYWMSLAYEHGDLTLVYPIARSTPAFLPLLAVPLLGEPVSAGGALGIAVVVAGMWLVHLGPRLGWAFSNNPVSGRISMMERTGLFMALGFNFHSGID